MAYISRNKLIINILIFQNFLFGTILVYGEQNTFTMKKMLIPCVLLLSAATIYATSPSKSVNVKAQATAYSRTAAARDTVPTGPDTTKKPTINYNR